MQITDKADFLKQLENDDTFFNLVKNKPPIVEMVKNILAEMTANLEDAKQLNLIGRLFCLLPQQDIPAWLPTIDSYYFSESTSSLKKNQYRTYNFIKDVFLSCNSAISNTIPAQLLSKKDEVFEAASKLDNVENFKKYFLQMGPSHYHKAMRAACKNGSIEIVRYLLLVYNSKPSNALSKALTEACASHNFEVAKFVIDQCNALPFSVMMTAISYNRLDTVKYLSEKGVMLNQKEDGTPPLHEADSLEMIRLLIDLGADKTAKTSTDRTRLHLACQKQQYAIIKELLELGFSCEDIDTMGRTPIDYLFDSDSWLNNREFAELIAAFANKKDIILHRFLRSSLPSEHSYGLQKLIDAGCNLNSTDSSGQTPFQIAAAHNNYVAIKFFIGKPQYSLSVLFKSKINISKLIEINAVFLNAKDSEGNSLLHLAVLHQKPLLLANLIEKYKLNPEEKNKKGETPLVLACLRKNQKILKYLIIHSPTLLFDDSKTDQCPLFLAWKKATKDFIPFLCTDIQMPIKEHLKCALLAKNTEGLKYLVAHYFNELLETNFSPLQFALSHGLEIAYDYLKEKPHALLELDLKNLANFELFRKIVSSDVVKAEYVDKNGMNLLHIACLQGRVEAVQIVLQSKKFSCETPNSQGELPLFLVSHQKLVCTLIEEGSANPLVKNQEGKTLFAKALETGNMKTASYLHSKNFYETSDISLKFPIQKGCENIVIDFLRKGASPNVKDINGLFPLQAACNHRLNDVVRALLEHGAGANLKGVTGEFPLLIACKNGDVEIADLLIRRGAFINVHDANQEYPITYACKNKQQALALMILKNQGTPFIRVKGYNTLAHLAAFNGLEEVTRYLIENYPNLSVNDKTFMACVCSGGKLELLRYLIEEKKFPIDRENSHYLLCAAKSDLGCFLYLLDHCKFPFADKQLQIAYASGNIQLIDLLRFKLDLDFQAKEGNWPFILACMHGHLHVVQHHVKNVGSDRNVYEKGLFESCNKGHLLLVRYFLEEMKLNPNIKDADGQTLLHCACRFGNVEIARYLIDHHQANPNEPVNGKSPALLACINNKFEIIKFLHKEKKFNFTIIHLFNSITNGDKQIVEYFIEEIKIKLQETIAGQNALHIACQHGKKEIVAYLLEKRYFTIDSLDHFQHTPFHYACSGNNLELAKYLRKQKCYLQPLDKNSQTPLHYACSFGHKAIVEFLVAQGHLLDPQDDFGNTPLHYSVISSKNEARAILEILLSKNANRDIENRKGETPLLLASHQEDKNLISCLMEKKHYPFIPKSLIDHTDDVIKLLRRESYRINPEHMYKLCSIKPGHYAEVEEIAIGSEEIPACDYVQELQALFDTINFTHSDQPGYIDPDKCTDDGVLIKNRHPNVIEALKKALNNFSCKVKNRGQENGANTLVAAPPLKDGEETRERKNYFDKLQFLVARVVLKMKEEGCDPFDRNEHLLSFAIAGFHCATRFLGEALAAYEYLVLKKSPTMDDKVIKIYSNLRLGCVEKLSTQINAVNLHLLNSFRRLIKTERGIPGIFYEGDPYDHSLAKDKALQLFDAQYNVAAIVQRLDGAVNGAAREFTVEEVNDWFVSKLMPEGWERGDFLKRTIMDSQGNVRITALLKVLDRIGIVDTSRLQGYLDENEYEKLGYELLDKIEEEDEDTALNLIKKGALLDIEDTTGRRALQIAAAAGSKAVVMELLHQGAQVNAKDHQGLTALHEAAKGDSAEIVVLLLKAGAKIDKKTKKKETALHLAAKSGKAQIYDLLLENGADENRLDENQHTPAYYATLHLKRRAVSLAENPLNELCKKGKSDFLEGAIGDMEKIKMADQKGYTPLHHACESGSLDIVKKLLSAYPEGLNRTTLETDTLLHCASRSRNETLILYLVKEKGMNINVYNAKGETPLYLALELNRLNVAKELLRNGAIIEVRSYQISLEYEIDFKQLIEGLENQPDLMEKLKQLDTRFTKKRN